MHWGTNVGGEANVPQCVVRSSVVKVPAVIWSSMYIWITFGNMPLCKYILRTAPVIELESQSAEH